MARLRKSKKSGWRNLDLRFGGLTKMNETNFAIKLPISIFLLACLPLTAVIAQQITTQKNRADQRIFDRNQRQREVQVTDKSNVNTEPVIEPNSIRVHIRYQKEYGYLTSNKPNNQEPFSCNAFVVDGGVWTGQPGTFGGNKRGGTNDVLMTIVSPSSMRVADGYYVCDFTIEHVPLNESFNVKASLVDNPNVLTGRWRDGSQPQPPTGSERLILNGKRNVRLTNSNPGATLDFEMVYKSIPASPR
jgi:hypothetical protein